MLEEWRIIEGLDNYEISSFGNVDSRKTSGPRRPSRNKQGVEMMTFFQDGHYVTRAVSLLVANTFLQEPPRDDFTTPIHLDGDRSNCRVDNLMWRPRWFAIDYHRERRQDPFPNWARPFKVIETGEEFEHPMHCAIAYGLLEDGRYGILHAIMNATEIFPTGFSFRW
jgi:hypothetical protein